MNKKATLNEKEPEKKSIHADMRFKFKFSFASFFSFSQFFWSLSRHYVCTYEKKA
jgi:hypothetical protein